MKHRIPPQIISEVLHLSLKGQSVRAIAQIVEISVGGVHSIIQEFATNDSNYQLLRILAINLRKNGSDILEYAWLVRLRNVLQNAGASPAEVEKIITEIPVFCYKAGIDVETLVDQLRMFIDYLAVNPGDFNQRNMITESYNKSLEYYNTCIQKHETDTEDELKNLLEFNLTDDKVQEVNELPTTKFTNYRLTKPEMVERIIDIIKKPVNYEDLFFWGPEIGSSPLSQ